MQAPRRLYRRIRFRSRLLRRPTVMARHRSLTPLDAFLASYPRSGTTWLRFLLYESLTTEDSGFGLMRRAIPSVGKQGGARPVLAGGGRIVQTHEPFCDRDRKVVYAVRDARSVVSSEYSWQQRSGYYAGSFDRFVRDFCRGRSNPWGSWGEHVDFWRHSEPAERGHLLVVRYEDLRADTARVFKDILAFLEAEVDDDVVAAAIANNSIEGMRAKEDLAAEAGSRRAARPDIRFVNTGTTSGWRQRLSAEQVAAIEDRFGPQLESLGYAVTALA
jgi:Sulfotransferase domain